MIKYKVMINSNRCNSNNYNNNNSKLNKINLMIYSNYKQAQFLVMNNLKSFPSHK
jgi:hypothetical protein